MLWDAALELAELKSGTAEEPTAPERRPPWAGLLAGPIMGLGIGTLLAALLFDVFRPARRSSAAGSLLFLHRPSRTYPESKTVPSRCSPAAERGSFGQTTRPVDAS